MQTKSLYERLGGYDAIAACALINSASFSSYESQDAPILEWQRTRARGGHPGALYAAHAYCG